LFEMRWNLNVVWLYISIVVKKLAIFWHVHWSFVLILLRIVCLVHLISVLLILWEVCVLNF
jgi:hypothetical protein